MTNPTKAVVLVAKIELLQRRFNLETSDSGGAIRRGTEKAY